MIYVWLSSGFCMTLPTKYCLKNEQEHIITFKNARWSQEFLRLIMHAVTFLIGFKISDVDQLILALIII